MERIAQTIQLQIAHILIMHLIIVLVMGVCLDISGGGGEWWEAVIIVRGGVLFSAYFVVRR